MLREQIDDCNILGPLTSIAEGKAFFLRNTEHIDIIIADIQLNDGLSFLALADAPVDVPIIFTTAYEEYALKAFEYNSLSYLLKPVDDDELRIAIQKCQQRLITDEHRKELFRVIASQMHYRERLFVKTFKGEKVVNMSEVRYFVSEQKNTYVKLINGTSYELDKALSTLEEELNPKEYMRVNRKYIVPLREIDHIDACENNKESLVLRNDNPPEIIISRDNRKNVHNWLRGE